MKESPIFVKTQVFLVWVLEHAQRFPKTQRFVMAKRVQDAIAVASQKAGDIAK